MKEILDSPEFNRDCQEWVDHQLKIYPGSKEDVLQFIGHILYCIGDEGSEHIRLLFHSGYCYYFAKMLQDAFEGTICKVKNISHFLWRDDRDEHEFGIYYDIEGVFIRYSNDDEIIPITELNDFDIESYRHRIFDEFGREPIY